MKNSWKNLSWQAILWYARFPLIALLGTILIFLAADVLGAGSKAETAPEIPAGKVAVTLELKNFSVNSDEEVSQGTVVNLMSFDSELNEAVYLSYDAQIVKVHSSAGGAELFTVFVWAEEAELIAKYNSTGITAVIVGFG